MTASLEALNALVKGTLEACAEKARAYGLPLPTVDVKATMRGRSRRGYCQYSRATGRSTITLNPDYFAVVGEAYAQTIAHEYAHAIVFAGKGTRFPLDTPPHGGCWKAVMRVLGYAPERCSDYEAAPERARKVKRYEYQCMGCGFLAQFTAQRHARCQKGATWSHMVSKCSGAKHANRTFVATGKTVVA